ncbi:hypothetical protein LSUE1_G003468 [Lachnellula suecica]|uniref:Uncharacterized protein n=1 Tax=Lachnellula suecica TaxID=602035 RepID=A0A8T9CD85_9HELO|nr:hypothetical protein LSUE1_G003468 [Lachnellula suecica]
MTSAKGKPTDPKLKEEVTEEVKQQPNKDGSGKGKMAAWKLPILPMLYSDQYIIHPTTPADEVQQANKIGKEYEARGGDYENEPGSKDKPEKGAPVKKSNAEKEAETKETKETKVSDAVYIPPELPPEIPMVGQGSMKIKLNHKLRLYARRAVITTPRDYGMRGSIPGSAYFVPKVSSPLSRHFYASDASSIESFTSDSDSQDDNPSEKKAGRPKGSKETGKKESDKKESDKKGPGKKQKEPVAGERTSARQAGKKADGKELPASTHSKRKHDDDEPAPKKKGKKAE